MTMCLFFVTSHWIFLMDLERKSIGTGGLRNAYESFRRSRDESLTRNNSRKFDDRSLPTTSPTSTLSSTNASLPAVSDEFFHILANFDRPIVITLKGVFKQVEFPKSSSIDRVKFVYLKESDRLTDEDIFKFLTDFRKPPTLAKKPKMVPGN